MVLQYLYICKHRICSHTKHIKLKCVWFTNPHGQCWFNILDVLLQLLTKDKLMLCSFPDDGISDGVQVLISIFYSWGLMDRRSVGINRYEMLVLYQQCMLDQSSTQIRMGTIVSFRMVGGLGVMLLFRQFV